MSEILIQCQDLHKRYGRKEALCGVNLRLESGKIVGLLGPNGSGKTTLIKILNGLLKPDQGMVTIDGEEPGIHTKISNQLSSGQALFCRLDEDYRSAGAV